MNVPPSHETLGLVGLGLMGTAIAERLISAGWKVIGWDINPERRAQLEAAGGVSASGLDAVFRSCGRILMSLPTDDAVNDVLRADDPEWRSGQTLIDTTTGAAEAAAERAERLATRGVAYLDATISGSSQQLRAGEAVFMVGAENLAFEACRDLWACLAARSFHTGPPGSGMRMKLVTNLVLGLNRAALAEGLAFAEAMGVAPRSALEVLAASPAYSRIMDLKGRKMVEADYTPQARLSQHLKDVRLILQAAESADLALPLSEAHAGLLERAEAAGWGDLDNSALIEAIRRRPS